MAGGPDDLLEREGELGVVAERLHAAARGEGSVLVLEGVAGAGKTALLRAVRAAAADAGFAVLTAVGGELERDFPFGLVRQLFEPRVAAADAAERARLFTGAAAGASTVIGGSAPAAETGTDATFAVLHGLYWVSAALAEQGPLLLAVDDAHWGDTGSLRFLEFLGRRAPELRLLVAVATRPDEPGAEAELLHAIADGPGARVVRPAPLSAGGVAAVLGDVGDDVVATAVETTGGNPLLTTELARTLADAETAPTPDAVRAAVPSSVARSVARRLARLPEDARTVAVALAVLGDGRRPELLGAVTGLDGPRLAAALDALDAAALVAGRPPRFTHPLVGTATAGGASPSERDRLHHDAARVLRTDDPAGELALHLLASGPIGEPWAVDALREAAGRALAEGAPEEAVRLLHRAEAERPAPAIRERLGLELGVAALRAGSEEAPAYLKAATEATERAVVVAATELVMATGLIIDVPDAVIHAAMQEAVDGLDPEADAEAYDRIGNTLINALSFPGRADRRRATLDALHRTAPGLSAHRAFEYAAGPETAAEIVEQADLTAAADSLEPRRLERAMGLWAVLALTSVEAARADAWLTGAERVLRRHPTRYGVAFHTMVRGNWLLVHGSAAAAEAAARTCLELFRLAANELSVNYAHADLASALVLRDDLDGAAEALSHVADDAFFDAVWGGGHVWTARAELELAQGRPRAALDTLARLDALLARYGWARYPRGAHRALQAEALLADGRADEALALARTEADEQLRRDAPRLAAEALRVAGLAGDGPAALERAVAQARRPGGGSVALARALLDHGAALRRAGRRVDARDILTEARAGAARAGAVALERRAVDELVIAGARPRRHAVTGVDALTASERRMAEHAADGLTNREIAETLFVTRKTVETTLGHAYAKLGIRSRTQLEEALRG